jgi:hypothetical protein
MPPKKSKAEKKKDLKPTRNKDNNSDEAQFKKDLKELEELNKLNQEMTHTINEVQGLNSLKERATMELGLFNQVHGSYRDILMV